MAKTWQPIETAPYRNILVFMPEDTRQPIQAAVWRENVKVIGNHFHFDMHKATHWMDLPEVPEVES